MAVCPFLRTDLPQTSMQLPCKQCEAGFTLIELIIVLVVLGIISVYAVMKSEPSATLTLPSQARDMASDILHAQTLASTQGVSLRLAICSGANGTYTVSNTSSAATACNQSAVTDPATGSPFSVSLKQGVVLGGSPTTLDISSLGQPSVAASYTLTSNGATETVAVAALTGQVTVTP